MAVSRTEKIILIVMTLALWIVLAIYAGAPVFSDEFMYIDIGLRNFKEPSYGNRYFHIYLEKFFMDLAPTPLQGVRIFWGFLVAATMGLVYYNARTFTKKSHPLHGLLAAAFFFTYPLITVFSGEPAVDITAMLMVILYISIYLIGVRKPEKRNVVLIILGALAFLSFKTKETTIFVNMMLFGYVLDEDEHWCWDNLWKMVKPLLIGLAIAILIFMLLDGFILGDPFFSINPATFGAIFTHYTFDNHFLYGPTSWYDQYFLDDILLSFMLFLMGGMRLKDEIGFRRKLVWIYPLVMAVFVTLNMMKIPWGFIERFYFPALPVVAMLAPQFLQFDLPHKKRDWLYFGLLLAASAGLIFLLREAMLNYAYLMHFEYTRILESLYYPTLLSILLAYGIWVKRINWASAVLPLFCIAGMIFSPLMYTQKYFFRISEMNERYDEIMYPYNEFGDDLTLGEDDRVYIAQSLDEELDMLSDDPNENIGMYNFYYDARIDNSNVMMGYGRKSMYKQLSTKKLSHALLSLEDWQWLLQTEEDPGLLESMYAVQMDSQDKLVLLVRK